MEGSAWYTRRLKRLLRHVFLPWTDPFINAVFSHHSGWLLAGVHYIFEMPLLILDCVWMPEIVTFFQSMMKPEARGLSEIEQRSANFVFRGQVSLQRIRIDEKSRVGTFQGKYAYVTFYCINSMGKLSLPVLIHEIAHVLQFEQDGSPYLFRNIMAHLSKDKYNYGGVDKLRVMLEKPGHIHLLNYEQRADIISDYFLLREGNLPEWGFATQQDLPIYYEVISLMLRIKLITGN